MAQPRVLPVAVSPAGCPPSSVGPGVAADFFDDLQYGIALDLRLGGGGWDAQVVNEANVTAAVLNAATVFSSAAISTQRKYPGKLTTVRNLVATATTRTLADNKKY